jgi:hypothetical protein
VGAEVSLNAQGSSDADGDDLTYSWTLQSQPQGSEASLQNATSSQANFTADVAGSYVVNLVVNDGTVDSAADSVTITVTAQDPESTDITDIEFSRRQGSCIQYVGEYFSNATDIKRGQAFSGSVVISDDGQSCTFRSNEIPNHDFNDESAAFATDVSEQNGNYTVTAAPEFAANVTELDLGTTNVVFLNGVTVDLLAAACYDVGNEPLGQERIGCGQDQIDNPWRYDPMSSLNRFGTDQHNAHSQPDGTYHYHGDPLAMYDQDCLVNNQASPVVGFAADGFPVFGPCFSDPDSGVVRKAQSSYQLKEGARQAVAGYTTPQTGNGVVDSNNYDGQFRGDYQYQADSGDLDECNGMTIDGQYGYYLTDTYPWVLGCFKGTTDASFDKMGAALKNRMHGH